MLVPDKRAVSGSRGDEPPPLWIRGLLVLTCTGVSFAHGSNDGQKGMGLIMLILIGTVPTAYALNHAVTARQSQEFVTVSTQAADVLSRYVSPNAVIGDARDDATAFIRTREFNPNTMLALRRWSATSATKWPCTRNSSTCRRTARRTSATTCTW